jgi:hypothetical protein
VTTPTTAVQSTSTATLAPTAATSSPSGNTLEPTPLSTTGGDSLEPTSFATATPGQTVPPSLATVPPSEVSPTTSSSSTTLNPTWWVSPTTSVPSQGDTPLPTTTTTALPSTSTATLTPIAIVAPSQSDTVEPTVALTTEGTNSPTNAPTRVAEFMPPTIDPTNPGTLESTPIPTPAQTAAPTVAPTNPSQPEDGTRFSVEYILSGTDPSGDQFNVAEEITLQYLEDYVNQQFEFNPLTNLENFDGATLGTELNPTRASYSVDLTFTDDSTIIPTQADIDVLIEGAFLQPFVQTLIDLLGEVSSDNPFSTTSNVIYTMSSNRSKSIDLPSPTSVPARTQMPSYEQSSIIPVQQIVSTTKATFPSPETIQTPTRSPFSFAFATEPGPPDDPTSAAVTETNDIILIATQFAVEYVFSGSDPTDEELNATQTVTIQYLQDFLVEQCMLDFNTSIVSFAGRGTLSALSRSQSIYNINVTVSETSQDAPSEDDLDILLAVAFEEPFAQPLLMALRKLPAENPIASTSEIIYGTVESAEPTKDTRSISVFGIGLLSSFAVLFAVVLGLAV